MELAGVTFVDVDMRELERAGEHAGVVWSGIHPYGMAIIFTITTSTDLVIGFPDREREPVRITRQGTTVAVGASVFVNWPSLPHLTEVHFAAQNHASFTMVVDPAALPAISRWAPAHR